MNARASVLIVDDEPFVRESLAEILAAEGFRTFVADGAHAAAAVLAQESVEAIVTDLKMPSGDGLALIADAKNRGVAVPILVITGHGTVSDAVAAMKAGAWDFVQKPVDPEELLLLVRRAVEHHGLLSEVRLLRDRIRERDSHVLVGSSPSIAQVRARITQVAKADATVLISGESGTGKEVAAHEIHRLSARAEKSLVRVDCAAVHEERFENELFGHVQGAGPSASGASAATRDRRGRFAEAEGGTLVLDEISALKPGMQAKLLRVLESGEYQVIGDPRTRFASARVIATTNQELAQLVQAGAFRADLFYRLDRFPIVMPPLRAHMEDLPAIAEHLLARAQHGERAFESSAEARLGADALEVLGSYGWPGNVRELRNVLERALIVAGSEPLGPELFQSILESALPSRPPVGTGDLHLRRNLDAVEKEIVQSALARSQGKKKEAAHMLGIDPRNLGYYLRKHRITDS